MRKKFLLSGAFIWGLFLGFLFFNINSVKAATGYCLCQTGQPCISITNYTGSASNDCVKICAATPDKISGLRVFATQEECNKANNGDQIRYCMCQVDFTKINNFSLAKTTGCLQYNPTIYPKYCTKESQGTGYDICDNYYGAAECQNALTTWQTNFYNLKSKETSASIGSFMPLCALEDSLTPACRDVSIFVVLLVNIGKYLFSIVGALALLVMIISGFQLVTSQGNAEKVKSGFQMMLGAGIGLAIVFGAYMLVTYLARLMGVDANLILFNQ